MQLLTFEGGSAAGGFATMGESSIEVEMVEADVSGEAQVRACVGGRSYVGFWGWAGRDWNGGTWKGGDPWRGGHMRGL